MARFTFVDLFAGAGGFTLGLMRADGTPSLVIDSNADCAETLRTNFPEAEVVCADVRDVGFTRPADIVVAGPPCQGFSSLNRRPIYARS